jgi:hypothetical protein
VKLEAIGPDIWIADGPEIKFLGLVLGTRMTIVRLNDGNVWIHSPIQFQADLAKEIEQIGPIRFLVAPNTYHHLFLREWQDHYPDAELVGPIGLPTKRPDLAFSSLLDPSAPQPWATDIDRVVFTGSRAFDEHVFFHRASRTAILTDLIVNVRLEKQSRLGRLIAQIEGVAFPNGRTPLLFRLGMRDKAAGARAVAAILAWGPSQAIISHGEWFRQNASEELRKRFDWLPLKP